MEEDVKNAIDTHMKDDERRFNEITHMLLIMKDNHLAHIETDLASLKIHQAISGERDKWLVRLLMGLILPVIGGFVGIIYQVITSLLAH